MTIPIDLIIRGNSCAGHWLRQDTGLIGLSVFAMKRRNSLPPSLESQSPSLSKRKKSKCAKSTSCASTRSTVPIKWQLSSSQKSHAKSIFAINGRQYSFIHADLYFWQDATNTIYTCHLLSSLSWPQETYRSQIFSTAAWANYRNG